MTAKNAVDSAVATEAPEVPVAKTEAKKGKTSVAAVLPEDVFQGFDDYRWTNRLSKSQTLVELIRKGIAASA